MTMTMMRATCMTSFCFPKSGPTNKHKPHTLRLRIHPSAHTQHTAWQCRMALPVCRAFGCLEVIADEAHRSPIPPWALLFDAHPALTRPKPTTAQWTHGLRTLWDNDDCLAARTRAAVAALERFTECDCLLHATHPIPPQRPPPPTQELLTSRPTTPRVTSTPLIETTYINCPSKP